MSSRSRSKKGSSSSSKPVSQRGRIDPRDGEKILDSDSENLDPNIVEPVPPPERGSSKRKVSAVAAEGASKRAIKTRKAPSSPQKRQSPQGSAASHADEDEDEGVVAQLDNEEPKTQRKRRGTRKTREKEEIQPKKKQQKEDLNENDEKKEDAPCATPPQTPQIERAKALCLSVKRHLARPLVQDEAGDDDDDDKPTLLPQTPRVGKLRGAEVVSKADYDELLQRFNQLKSLRTTKAEKMYAKLHTTTEAREQASAKYIQSLKSENKRLQEELLLATQAKDTKPTPKGAEDEPEDRSRLQETLAFFQQLTLVKADPYPEEGNSTFLCSCKNPKDKRAFKFVLTMAEDAVEYKPLEIGKQPRWEMNEMFTKEIYFSPHFAPIFLSKMLATVYGTKQSTQ